jgi:hypothetical protein
MDTKLISTLVSLRNDLLIVKRKAQKLLPPLDTDDNAVTNEVAMASEKAIRVLNEEIMKFIPSDKR